VLTILATRIRCHAKVFDAKLWKCRNELELSIVQNKCNDTKMSDIAYDLCIEMSFVKFV